LSIVRVLLSEPPAANRAEAWVRCDDTGRVVERGHDTPDRWPPASRREAVLAAGLVRLIAIALPPMSPAITRTLCSGTFSTSLASSAR